MRILYLTPAAGLGGAERCLLTYLAALRQTRPEADLHLLATADGPLLAKAAVLGVTTHLRVLPAALAGLGDSALQGRSRLGAALSLVPRSAALALATQRYARQLRQTLDELRPDLVHSNGLKMHVLGRLTGWCRSPVVWHLHDFLGQRPLMARALRWASGRTSLALAVSQAVADDARAVLPRVPISVVYNAVEVEHCTPGPGDGAWLDALGGLPPAATPVLRVGLVATYARWKGHLVFLDAAAQVLRDNRQQQLRFYLVGGPIYQTAGSQFSEAELRAHAAQLGIAAQVGFVGFQQDPVPVFRALDVVVHASTQPEPFGLTIVEAMACGRPVVVARAGGAAELFTEQLDAVGVSPGDAVSLAEAIRRLAGASELRQRLAENARQTAVTRFSHHRLGLEVLAVYERLLSPGYTHRRSA